MRCLIIFMILMYKWTLWEVLYGHCTAPFPISISWSSMYNDPSPQSSPLGMDLADQPHCLLSPWWSDHSIPSRALPVSAFDGIISVRVSMTAMNLVVADRTWSSFQIAVLIWKHCCHCTVMVSASAFGQIHGFIICVIISMIDETRLCSTYCCDYLSDLIWSQYNIFMGLVWTSAHLCSPTKGVEGVIPTCFLLLVPFLESAMPFSTPSQSQHLGNFLMPWWVLSRIAYKDGIESAFDISWRATSCFHNVLLRYRPLLCLLPSHCLTNRTNPDMYSCRVNCIWYT